MKSIRYLAFPYCPESIEAIRTNDDGTYSLKSWYGTFYREYGPQKKRFDLRGGKPYIEVEWPDLLKIIMDNIRVDCLKTDLDSIGFGYSSWDCHAYRTRRFVQAGFNDDYLFVITERGDDDNLDCSVALINRRPKEEINLFTKQPYIRQPGVWRWHRYDERKTLNEDAVTMIGRPTTSKMAMDLFTSKFENQLADFKSWCGVVE